MNKGIAPASRCACCGDYGVKNDDLLCKVCLADGIYAYRDGPDIVEVVFPERMPIIYEVCVECGQYVDCADDSHPCPNWHHLRGRHPLYQIKWLSNHKEKIK